MLTLILLLFLTSTAHADTIYGYITHDSSTLPAQFVEVRVIRIMCGEENLLITVFTDYDGMYETGELEPGKYLVAPFSEYYDYKPKSVNIKVE
jgi:5-hydroxyisourate hydrolase-like protein (transthyretin family)